MDIIIFALGTSGDINPMIGVGREFSSRGFSVSFLTNDYFKDRIIEANLHFISVGTVDQYQKGNSDAAWCTNANMDNFAFYHAPAFEPAYNYIQSLVDPKNTLLLVIGEQNGAVAAAKKMQMPFIKFVLSPNLIFSTESPPAPLCWMIPKKLPAFLKKILVSMVEKKSFNAFYADESAREYMAVRERLNCPLKYERHSVALLQIGFFPEWFGMRAKDWPKNLRLVGFPLSDNVNTQARDEIAEFVEVNHPILFTTGTGVSDVTEVFVEGKKLCEKLAVHGLFVGGKKGLNVLEDSRFCRHIEYVDFEFVLPKCRAVVHHGGIGTLAQAIKAGIPQVIRPIKYDQPDNGNRIQKLGLGFCIHHDYFKVMSVAPAFEDLLKCAPSNRNLKMYSEDVKRSKAIQKACDLICEQIHLLVNSIDQFNGAFYEVN